MILNLDPIGYSADPGPWNLEDTAPLFADVNRQAMVWALEFASDARDAETIVSVAIAFRDFLVSVPSKAND